MPLLWEGKGLEDNSISCSACLSRVKNSKRMAVPVQNQDRVIMERTTIVGGFIDVLDG